MLTARTTRELERNTLTAESVHLPQSAADAVGPPWPGTSVFELGVSHDLYIYLDPEGEEERGGKGETRRESEEERLCSVPSHCRRGRCKYQLDVGCDECHQ